MERYQAWQALRIPSAEISTRLARRYLRPSIQRADLMRTIILVVRNILALRILSRTTTYARRRRRRFQCRAAGTLQEAGLWGTQEMCTQQHRRWLSVQHLQENSQ